MRLGRTLPLLVAAAGLFAAAALRARLSRERDELGLSPRPARETIAGAGFREALVLPHVVLSSAALGVFRPLAINFLWLRYLELQEEGEFLELPALTDAITALEPRLPMVWTYQAWNLGYNIAAAFPPADRHRWVWRAIRLLEDEALRYNPSSPWIHAELSYIFYHKIGLDFDEAGSDYRSRLAASLDVPARQAASLEVAGGPALAAAMAAWKIEPGLAAEAAASLGVAALDFRTAPAHAFYWAERGLRLAPAGTGRLDLETLHSRRLLALLQLLSAGQAWRAPDGASYVFVASLDYFPATRREVEREAAAGKERGDPQADQALLAFYAGAVLDHFLFGREEEARAIAAVARGVPGGEARGMEDLALTVFLGAPPEAASAEELRHGFEDCLESAVLLESLASEPRAASLRRGFIALARLLHPLLAAREQATTGSPAPGGAGDFDAALQRAREAARTPAPAGVERRRLPSRLDLLLPRSAGGGGER